VAQISLALCHGEHRELFTRDPKHCAPQYDGYCAMGTSNDEEAHKDTVDLEAWAIVDGRLYLTHNRYWMQVWRENAKEHIRQADQDWQAVKDLPAPEVVGPPCAASPPTTKVALRDGGQWVVIGGQVARDEAIPSKTLPLGRRAPRCQNSIRSPVDR
jgi:hypothetical protein